jgi:predicted naringenin-chalcone synthase
MSLVILGIGTALPETEFDQTEGLTVAQALIRPTAEQATWLPGIYQRSHIKKRHTVLPRQLVDDLLEGTRRSESIFLPSEGDGNGPPTAARMEVYRRSALPLAVHSCSLALEKSGLSGMQITHLVSISCTGFNAPGWDCGLVPRLQLPATIERTHIGFMGCHGALNGLRVARAYVDANPTACVLLCAVELCTLHYHYRWNPERTVANALFADGAAALVGVHDSAVLTAFPFRQRDSQESCWKVAASGAMLIPDTESEMSWTLGDHGFEMNLSKNVPELIRERLQTVIQSWLARQGESVSSIPSWIIHPGGPKILSAVGAALDLSRSQLDDSFATYSEHGNMSSPTVLFILERMQRLQKPRPCVAVGFGPGLAVECTLFK